MSLLDALRNFLSSLAPQEVEALHMKSCISCSFHKVILRDDFCGQVQPPSRILNLHDAQICIYFTPETVTTGQITQQERQTATSKIDLVDLITEITTIKTLEKIDLVTAITNITNIASLDLVDRITLIDAITNIANIEKIEQANVALLPNSHLLFNDTLTDGIPKGWVDTSTVKVTGETDSQMSMRIKFFGARNGYLEYYTWLDSNKYGRIAFWAYKPVADGSNLAGTVHYADGTSTDIDHVLTNSWALYIFEMVPNKTISFVTFYTVGMTGIMYLAFPQFVETNGTPLNILNLLVDEIDYAWSSGVLQTEVYKKGGTTIATLTYTWNGDGTLQKVVRT